MVESAHAAAELVAVMRPQRLHDPAYRAHSFRIALVDKIHVLGLAVVEQGLPARQRNGGARCLELRLKREGSLVEEAQVGALLLVLCSPPTLGERVRRDARALR